MILKVLGSYLELSKQRAHNKFTHCSIISKKRKFIELDKLIEEYIWGLVSQADMYLLAFSKMQRA